MSRARFLISLRDWPTGASVLSRDLWLLNCFLFLLDAPFADGCASTSAKDRLELMMAALLFETVRSGLLLLDGKGVLSFEIGDGFVCFFSFFVSQNCRIRGLSYHAPLPCTNLAAAAEDPCMGQGCSSAIARALLNAVCTLSKFWLIGCLQTSMLSGARMHGCVHSPREPAITDPPRWTALSAG